MEWVIPVTLLEVAGVIAALAAAGLVLLSAESTANDDIILRAREGTPEEGGTQPPVAEPDCRDLLIQHYEAHIQCNESYGAFEPLIAKIKKFPDLQVVPTGMTGLRYGSDFERYDSEDGLMSVLSPLGVLIGWRHRRRGTMRATQMVCKFPQRKIVNPQALSVNFFSEDGWTGVANYAIWHNENSSLDFVKSRYPQAYSQCMRARGVTANLQQCAQSRPRLEFCVLSTVSLGLGGYTVVVSFDTY